MTHLCILFSLPSFYHDLIATYGWPIVNRSSKGFLIGGSSSEGHNSLGSRPSFDHHLNHSGLKGRHYDNSDDDDERLDVDDDSQARGKSLSPSNDLHVDGKPIV